jgi:RND family efflux transporter MFP subunit
MNEEINKKEEASPEDVNKPASLENENEEEIIFPMEEEVLPKQRRSRFSFFNLMVFSLLAVAVYLLGYLTNPEKFDETVNHIKKTFSFAVKEIGPLEEKLTKIIETKIQRKPVGESDLPTLKEGSGTRSESTGRTIAYWRSPMNPNYIRDEPGKSPMGNDLIPVYEDEIGEQEIRISPNMTQNIGVKTEKIKIRKLSRTIRTVGRLTYDERRVMHVHTKYAGWIEKLHVDYTGKKVNKGDLLMEVYSPVLVSTQEELLLALKYNESLKDNPFPEISTGAESLLNSTRRKLELLDVPQHQIDTLIKEKKISKTMHIHSPVDGYVIKKPAVHGMRIKPGMGLYTIADLSNIWVFADIYEYELPWVKVGQPVKMELPYYPGKEFKGEITYIDPYLESKSRTIKVRMEFENKNGELKPDMYSNIILESVIDKETVAVPVEGVIRSGEKDIVIVVSKSGGFDSREVTLGAAADGYYQVLKGLQGDEEVVTSSGFLIDSESNLKEAISKLQEAQPMPTMKDMKKMKELPKMKNLSGTKNNNDGMVMERKNTIILKEDTNGL